MQYKTTYKTHLIGIISSMLFLAIFHKSVYNIITTFYININAFQPYNYTPTYYKCSYLFFITFITFFTVTNLHSLIHSLIYNCFGGKIKYQFSFILTAFEKRSKKRLSLNKFLIIMLSPATIISLLCLLLPSWIGNFIFILNIILSFNDIYHGISLIRYPYNSKIVNRNNRFIVILKN
ncbi:hypothetical protein GCM10008906_01370 [Clostridium oceanicum]|uniref:DUF3267 domain-containing protein n=2 Tax=Clostridium oceanicum TaxID=1543 RepID=A0ABP3UH20_9CLOT